MTVRICCEHRERIPLRPHLTDSIRSGRCRLLQLSMAIVVFLSPLQSVHAAFGKDNVGTSGAVFLKIGPGARPAAMGEAFTGVADDIHSIYWNPAGLARLRNPELTAMHMQWFQNVNYEYAAFAFPTKEQGTWGFAVTNLHTDDLQRRTEDTETSLGNFSSSDSAYWLSYGRAVTDKLSLGANAKFIRQVLDSTSANAYASDWGVLYDTQWKTLKLGASIQNVGSKVKFVNESDPLPMTGRAGASIQVIEGRMLLSSDVIAPRDHQVGLALGTEYRQKVSGDVRLIGRGGYRTDSDVKNGLTGVSAGGGIQMGRVAFDFGWVPFGELGSTYRYALHVKFGPAGKSSDDSRLENSPTDAYMLSR